MHARSPKLLEDIRDAAGFVGQVTTVQKQLPALLRTVQALVAQQP